jgi:hypothetical protein
MRRISTLISLFAATAAAALLAGSPLASATPGDIHWDASGPLSVSQV